ncbi:hypothetical protein F442_13756 [Phytophthora nicotianae P10297]|uniref:Uncharacterized protein n=1 Tax=Phytophthora nicotianae P10297 TaxID=1317064 RepID=W2YVA1_PHYNI|nr:hypothetical protein F442_13756 [Phytophthora nicotianae P10297]
MSPQSELKPAKKSDGPVTKTSIVFVARSYFATTPHEFMFSWKRCASLTIISPIASENMMNLSQFVSSSLCCYCSKRPTLHQDEKDDRRNFHN